MRVYHFPARETIDRICLFVFLATICLVIHRRFWRDRYDLYKCDALLANGRWLDDKHQNWQVPGCMIHNYQDNDLVTCFKHRRLVFIGDSSVRQLYWATARNFGIKGQSKDEHSDHSLHLHGATVEFRWDPYLNSSKLTTELTAAARSRKGTKVANSTATLVIGGGLWHARYLDEEHYLDQYRDALESIAQSMDPLSPNNAGGIPHRYNFDPWDAHGSVLMTPVPIPLYDALSPERAIAITPKKVDSLNLQLYRHSEVGNITVPWSFGFMISLDAALYQPDGLHFSHGLTSRMVDIILNLRCNNELRIASKQGSPMDKTCCNRYNPANWTQSIMLNAFIWLLPIVLFLAPNEPSRIPLVPSRKITRAVSVLALAISYCYIADRTPLFNKTQKQYTRKEFMLLCAITFILGFLSIRRSVTGSPHKRSPSPAASQKDQPFLSRQQTDEWKGWMQFIILIYHYIGASKVLWVYKIVRLLVASYIFLSGFGHTVYFYTKADYSFRRCAAVLIRLNLLSCVLPYMMGTGYDSYYFAPLISFWYMVIYATMAIGQSKNMSVKILIIKVLLSAGLVNLFIVRGVFFELLFHYLEKTCRIRWDLKEWRFRLQLDSYIAYIGMLCGILYVRVIETLRSETHGSSQLRGFLNKIHWVGPLYVVGTFLLYSWFTCEYGLDKYSFCALFPYVSAFPILAFVILRNYTRHARNFHSTIFAWMGRHSLETFTLQYHIWLAADTKGLLTLGVFERIFGGADGGRKVDFVVLTIIFLWICWHVAAATQTLTNWVVDSVEGRGDLGGNVNVNGDVELQSLPRNRSNENVRDGHGEEANVADGFSAGLMQTASRVKNVVAGDLRARLGLILAVMWLLNMVGDKKW